MTDQRPELNDDWFEKADAYQGEKLVRKGADTTDQQAVTVAQQHDWLDAWLIRDGFGYTKPADDMRAAIRHRLASVSSASAEGADRANGVGQDELVAGLKRALQHPAGDHDGWTDAGMEHAFFRWPVIVNALNEAMSSPANTLDEACDEDGSTDLHRNTPESVPATNQAGEVERRVKDLLRGPDGEEYTDSGMEDAFFRWPVIANALNEALAGPVPTGEGVSAPDKIWLCGFDTDHGDISWSSCPNPADDPEVDGKQVEYVRSTVATTPTPTTRLGDLLAALRSWEPEGDDRVRPLLLAEADRREALEYGVTDAHHVIAFLLHRLDAALATQPATSQEGEGFSREWCLNMAALEGNAEIGAGSLDHPLRLAPTQTPPTLSSDLREALEGQMEAWEADENLPSSIARERGLVWLEGWFDLRAALALAQVKAS